MRPEQAERLAESVEHAFEVVGAEDYSSAVDSLQKSLMIRRNSPHACPSARNNQTTNRGDQLALGEGARR